VEHARYADIDRTVMTMGKVTPVDGFQARANFAGTVEKLYVQVGQSVHAGQMLVKLKDPYAGSRLASAQADLLSDELSSHNIQQGGSQEDKINMAGDRTHTEIEQVAAAKALATLTALERTGAATVAEVNGGIRRLQSADATLQTIDRRMGDRYSPTEMAAWKARVAQAHAVVSAQEAAYANANVATPISGTVYLTPVSRYDFVPQGGDLVRVANLDKLQIVASFDEPEIGALADGQPVTITWDGRPDRQWHGRILHAPLAANASGTRSVGVCTISVDDGNRDLLPDTSVTVTVTTAKRVHVLAIPHQDLHEDPPSHFFVYRVIDGKLIRTPVSVGLVTVDQAEIVSGLTPNDVVAASALDGQDLRDGMKVRAMP
jgi:HlyD family secretion protein